MNNSKNNLINLPPFLFQNFNVYEMSFLKKIIFIIYGKLIQIIFKYFNGKIFCNLINFMLPNITKIEYNNNFYTKYIDDNLTIHYPNKRIVRVLDDTTKLFEKLYDTYCLNEINFKDGDSVLDCGANVGELNIAFYKKGIKINYIGFEPEKTTYNSLVKNRVNLNDEFVNVALSDKNGESKLFLDSQGGDSSIIFFGNKNFERVKTITLDSLGIEKPIKLFKLEAEGYEPEVLAGSKKTLKKIHYVSVDFGAERGLNSESTIVDVNKFLTNNKFELISFSKYRMVGLYRNKLM
jgi:FkbM family methyltransferase